jgi:hypothetical protein
MTPLCHMVTDSHLTLEPKAIEYGRGPPGGTRRMPEKRFDYEWTRVARDVYCAAWKHQMLTSI